MRRLFLALSMLSLAFGPVRVSAQLSAEEETEVDPAGEETSEEVDPYAEEEVDPSLREEELVEEEPAEDAEIEEEAPEETEEQTAPSGDPSRLSWSTPAMAFTLHGYMRTRAEIWRNFAIGRVTDDSGGRENYPFRYFYPLERGATVEGGCSGPITTDAAEDCYGGASRFRTANMRLRLQPTITVSDDIMVHMLVDAFDNMVLGSTPNSVSAGAGVSDSETGYVPGLSLDSFAYTMNPALSGRNSMQDSLYVRRAWAEVHAREIGQLWFGRMPNHWGLGMLFNDGAGIDGDFSSDVDRIMGIVQIQGFQLAAAWDFANQGAITHPGALNGVPFDATQRDDVRQFALIAAHRMDEEAQRRRIDAGGTVFNGGLYFQYRTQELSADTTTGDTTAETMSGLPSRIFDPTDDTYRFTRRNATSFTVDGWAQALWGDLRVELETALVVGHIGNTYIGDTQGNGRQRILQFGYVLQAEYRALDRKLGIYFDHGLASGDAQVNGLSNREDLVTQPDGDGDRITTFSFHPNYRIDQILFRNILGSINGVYYFRPGISYDLRRTDHGQIVGVRADAVYSRASTRHQTYGENANLGLELDASIYYRSELGPDALDGLYIIANYGLLFPLAGLGYSAAERDDGVTDKTSKAQTFRLILGVRF